MCHLPQLTHVVKAVLISVPVLSHIDRLTRRRKGTEQEAQLKPSEKGH